MLGALIAAGAALGGAYLNKRSADRNVDQQKSFAQNTLQWKAADAEKAGISKLYGIGAPTTSFAPVSVGGLGTSVADAGQHIGRAIQAQAGPTGRAGQIALELANAQLEGVKTDNLIKQQELTSRMNTNNQAGQPPGIITDNETPSMPGQGNSSLGRGIKLEKQISPAGYVPQKSFGVSPEIDMWRTTHGYAPEVPQQLGEAQESQPLSAAQWFIRNKIMPHLDHSFRTYPYEAGPGFHWTFDPVFGQYVKVPDRGSIGPTRQHSWEYLMDKMRR